MSTAHHDPKMVTEYEEDEETLRVKVKQVAALIRKSKHFCAFTGAGISTSAGIPDFRGPEGVWTLAATGQKRTAPTTVKRKAMPTKGHMALVELQNKGVLKYVISQNSDGFHRKSGILPQNISELHGNHNLEKCNKCGQEYLRDFDASATYAISSKEHKTGRYCSVPGCYGPLEDSIVNFGENLPEDVLDLAWSNTKKCDVMLAMGSSLTVTPACHMPRNVAKKKKGHLIICNLQKTQYDKLATVRVFAKSDHFMELVMNELQLGIPPFILQRLIRVTCAIQQDKSAKITITGIDVDNIPATFMEGVARVYQNKERVILTQDKEDFVLDVPQSEITNQIVLQVFFIGHYNELPVTLNLPQIHNYVVAYPLFWNPQIGKWDMGELLTGDKLPKTKQRKQMTSAEPEPLHSSRLAIAWPGPIATEGKGPSVRSACTMTYCNGKVGVFGGFYETTSNDKIYYNDMKVLDLGSMTWTDIPTQKHTPTPRSGHAAAVLGDRLFIFGGSQCFKPGLADNEKYFNDVYALTMSTTTWQKVACTGDIPQPRSFQSSFVSDNRYLFIFGGSTIVPEAFFDDLHCLDTHTSVWKKIQTHGQKPTPRDGATATVIGNKVYFIGGYSSVGFVETYCNDVYCLDLGSLTWEKLDFELPNYYTGLAWHTAGVAEFDDHPRIFTVGGTLGGIICNEVFIFDLATRKIHRIKGAGTPPGPRYFHGMCKVGRRQVLLTCGAGIPYTPNAFYDDLHTFVLPK